MAVPEEKTKEILDRHFPPRSKPFKCREKLRCDGKNISFGVRSQFASQFSYSTSCVSNFNQMT